jgi:hypothetical protein
MSAYPPRHLLLAAYDRTRACDLLRSSTAQGLRDALRGGHFGAALSPSDRAELDDLLTAWLQRALGGVFLRDALLVDGRRGPRVFGLICAGVTRARATMPPDLAALLRARGSGDLTLTDLADLAFRDPALARLADIAGREGLALALLDQSASYPLPADLDSLLPVPLPAHSFAGEGFSPPSGSRRAVAIALAVGGISLMLIPLLGGSIPQHPAGLPLALITLALLIGISARWAGWVGSSCIWLVANLPSFRHGTSLLALLPALPLLALGLALLLLDRRVRAMWVWVRQQIRR